MSKHRLSERYHASNAVLHENGLSVSFIVCQTINGDQEDPIIEGFIKWDGCAHWFTPEAFGYAHFCGPDDMDEFATALKACWPIAEEMMGERASF